MLLTISHRTEYTFDAPQSYGLERLLLIAKDGPGQTVQSWDLRLEGLKREAAFTDHHENDAVLASLEPGCDKISIVSSGTIETVSTNGIIGRHTGFAPLWYFSQTTALTLPGARVDGLIETLGTNIENDVERFHALSTLISDTVEYKGGATDAETTAEAALGIGSGVCQDHAHIFLAAARQMGFPARYVSGYLMMDDQVAQDATHAWAEVHIIGLGWVGFDISNGISPDERYVRMATGRDYHDAAPVSGLRMGGAAGGHTYQIQFTHSKRKKPRCHDI